MLPAVEKGATQMGMSNEELVRGWLAAGDAGAFDAFADYVHTDVVVHAPLGLAALGIDAERESWRSVLAGVPDLHHEVQEVVSAGSSVTARTVVTGSHMGEVVGLPATGKRFAIDQAVFAHVRDGKLSEIWEIADTAALLEQLQS